MIKRPRGTSDVLPSEAALWQKIEAAARRTAGNYGYCETRFPTFEATELFSRGVGDTTDVVQKEMYTFTDKDGRSMTLRPEGTASAVRSLVENGLYGGALPVKLFYITNCFRYEKPQAGRSREFTQFGIEAFGSNSALCDAQAISLAASLFRDLGIKGIRLYINSIGCRECRPAFHKALREYFASRSDELCDTCRGRLETNPMRILDCKSPVCKEIAKNAPKTLDYLCDDCKKHFETLREALAKLGLEFEVDTSIVRGLDYYTKTVFEFVYEGIGAQSTVCGGGRYDGLVESLDGPKLSGIGFAMGISRVILAMKESGVSEPELPKPAVYIASLGEKAAVEALAVSGKLQSAGIYADADVMGRSVKAQMKYADKIGARYTAVLGDDEIASGKAQLKAMDGSEMYEIALGTPDETAEAIKKVILG